MLPENYQQNASSDNIFIYEETEGGLNLKEIKDILSRKVVFIVGCTLAITSVVAVKILNTPPVYQSSFEILSEPFNLETKITSGNSNVQSAKTREAIAAIELDEIQLKILESPKIIDEIVLSLIDKYPDLNYQNLTRRISIDAIDTQSQQNIIAVKYNHTDEQRVIDVTEALAKTYVEYSLEKRQERVKKGIDFLDLQIPQLDRQVQEIEAQIKELRNKYNFVNADTYLQQLTNRLNSLQQLEKQINFELQEAELVQDNLQQELRTQLYSSTTAIDLATPRYLALLNKLQQIDLEISRTSVVFSDRSIEIEGLQQEREKIIALITRERQSIYQKLNNRITILKNRLQNTAREKAAVQSQLQEWSAISPNYDRLQEELKVAKNQLGEFTRQKDALLIDLAQQEAPWQLLTPVTEPVVNSSNAINYLILGSTLGLFVGVAASLLSGGLNNILYTSQQLEELTKIPIIGEIPYSKPEKNAIKAPESNSQNTQLLNQFSCKIAFLPLAPFSSIAANLDSDVNNNILSGSNLAIAGQSQGKSIAITSAIAGEGKSTVAFNLARAYASLSKKVLLVDMDLRCNGNLTKNLGLESQIGLINILGHDVSSSIAQHHIQQLQLSKNLFILPSGFKLSKENEIALEPSLLLASTKMPHLINKLESDFDVIIYDFCHINGLPDVNLLASKTDGIVMVAGMGKIQATELTQAQKQLKLSKANVLGLVANQVIGKK